MQNQKIKMERRLVTTASIIKLGQRIRLSFDKTRQQWVLLGPEKVISLDDIAYQIISRCDGSCNVSTLIEQLATEYNAATEDIEQDVLSLLQSLVDKRFMQL